MKNAIVILNYNDFDTTQKLVNHILNMEELEKIVIVDNCSTDDSLSNFNKKYANNEKIDIVSATQNKGYATGNNIGVNYVIERYSPQYVFIANPDVLFEKDVIIEVDTVFGQHNDIAILAPKVSKGYNSWQLPNFSKALASNFLLLSKKVGNKVYEKQFEDINYVDVVAGSLFAIRSDVFKEIKGFDERTFLYYEENIMAFKLKEKNYKEAILGNVKYEHCHAASIKKTYKSKLKLFKIINKSIKIYINDYLKVNNLQKIIFYVCSVLSYIERAIYGAYYKIKNSLGVKQ